MKIYIAQFHLTIEGLPDSAPRPALMEILEMPDGRIRVFGTSTQLFDYLVILSKDYDIDLI